MKSEGLKLNISTLSNYEKLVLNTILNAGDKIIDACCLYNTKHSFRSSLALTIIAQEELSKLVVIPFAYFGDYLDELNTKDSPLYNHRIKQAIFTSFGIQNRSYKKIEKIKHECLYVTPTIEQSSNMPVVDNKQSFDEINKAVQLFEQLANLNFRASDLISNDLKQLIGKYVKNIFIPAINDLMPELKVHAPDSNKEFIQKPEIMLRLYPLLFIEMVMEAFPLSYKQFFKDIKGKTFNQVLHKLEAMVELEKHEHHMN